MALIRLIPLTDDALFPYPAARAAILNLIGMSIKEVDFPAMIEAGKRIGWPKAMIDAHWGLMQRGKCFTFSQELPDGSEGLRGTMFENNISFGFVGQDHKDRCLAEIERLARVLSVRVLAQ